MSLAKRFFAVFFVVFTIFFLVGCANNGFAKEKLSSNLYSPFTATADFIISDEKNNIVGKAEIQKGEKITIKITEPEGYKNICISSDSTGKSDIISFEFSGIPANVPKSSASALSLMLSLFSDDMPSKISSLGKDSFRVLSENQAYCEVFFVENGTNYKITYDKNSAFPCMFDAGNDKMSINIVLSDFTPIQQE